MSNARLAVKTLPLILATILLLLASLGSATQMDSANYNQTKTAIASGGKNISSTNYAATITIGQIIGTVSSTKYNTTLGFQADEFGSNTAPTIESLILNATDNPLNTSNANLTAYVTASDADSDDIGYAWDWRTENTSIAILNMNFDVNDSAGSGKTKDYTTYSNNGTVNGATWNATGGWNGTGAYEFDESKYIEIPNDASFNINKGFTITAWVRVDNTSASGELFSKVTDGSDKQYALAIGEKLGFDYEYNANNFAIRGGSIIEGEWQHVAVSIDDNLNISLYVDGNVVNSTIAPHETTTTTEPLEIGRMGGTYDSRYFEGAVDEFRFYNRVLSQSQIAALADNHSDLITSDETSAGENWSVCATPNDGTEDGSEACSDEIEIQEVPNDPPVITSLIMNATDNPDNTTAANLTAYTTAADADGDNISYAYDWRTENTSIAVLNMNFDVNNSAGTGKTKDYTTYSNNGTINGATWNATGGWNGTGAYEFGSGKFISVGDIGPFTDYTVAAWINSTGAGDGTAQRIVAKTPDADHYELALQIEEVTDKYACYLENNGNGNSVKVSSTTTAAANRNIWMYVACTFDDAGNNISLYVNGVLENTSTTTLSVPNTDEEAVIGVLRDTSTTNYFVGTIDQVLIFDKSLSPTQIAVLYNNRTDLITSDETSTSENWSVCATPNDGKDDGTKVCSSELEIQSDNSAPVVSSIIMNATDNPLNTSNANLTAHVTASDANNDNISYAWDWRKENVSIAILNTNFDVNNSAGSGKTKDYSTFGNNLSEKNSPTWNATAGWNGTGAYSFDGTNDYLRTDNTVPITVEDGFATSFWMKADSFKTLTACYYGGVISQWPTATGTQTTAFYVALNNPNSCSGTANYIRFFVGGTIALTITDPLNTDEWYHIVTTYDGSTAKIYINGVLNNTKEQVVTGTYDYGINLGYRGYDSNQAQEYFDGTLDEVKVYSHPLSASQVLALYNNRSDLITSNETSAGENWSVCATPNDGTEDGNKVCSNEIEIQNSAPEVSSLILNATDNPDNTTAANLTAYVTASDPDSDDISYAYDWRKENTSIAVLNMNFDVEDSAGSGKTKDYTTYSNNGTVNNATWNATGGWNGTGAYVFDGDNDFINLSSKTQMTTYTISSWVYMNSLPSSGSKEELFGRRSSQGVAFYNDGGTNKVLIYHWGDDCTVTYTPPLNSWFYFTVRYGGSSRELFINGSSIGSCTGAGGPSSDSTHYYWLGAREESDGSPVDDFDGRIDSFLFFNYSLSTPQISALYNNHPNLIVSNETTVGENWSVCVTPNDGTEDGNQACSNKIRIQTPNNPPNITSLILNATDNPLNTTAANLTAYVTASDADGDNISYTYDWRKENMSIAVLNMNFDVEDSAGSGKTKDYTTYSNNGNITNARWAHSSGRNNTGAYQFDGVGDYVELPNIDFSGNFTFSAWIYPNINTTQTIMSRSSLCAATDRGDRAMHLYMTSDGRLRYDTGATLNCGGGSNKDGYYSDTGYVNQSTWTFVTVSVVNNDLDTRDVTLYVNGEEINNTLSDGGANAFSQYAGQKTRIGAVYPADDGDWYSGSFNGTIDNVNIYNYTLSASQVLALYNNRSDLITSDETSAGENWSVCVTPNDGTEDGNEVCSNTLHIESQECTIDADCAAGKACYYNHCFSDHGAWILRNASQDVSWIDSYGRMMIAGTKSESQGSCSGEFPIEAAGTTVGAIDKDGNLCLTGTLSESRSLPLTAPTGGGLLIRNGTGSNVAYVDTSGNLVLGLDLIQNGFS